MDIKLIIKSFIIGIGKIIPGVSGSMLAMTLGIYEELIFAITHFFNDVKKNGKLLFNFAIGLFLAMTLFSRILLFLLSNYYAFTMYLFLGLILGTCFKFSKEIHFNKKNICFFIIVIVLSFLLPFVSIQSEFLFQASVSHYIYTSFLGIIDAATSIIPGISGTAIFMCLGSYEFVLTILGNPFTFLFIVYGLGLVLGIILVSYLMHYLLTNKKEGTYSVIFAFSISSLLFIFLSISSSFNFFTCFILIIGIILGYLFDK